MHWQIRSIFLIFIAYNLIALNFVPLHADETYYWALTHHLALSYYDHPPLIVYLIKLFTLFSDKVFFIRLAGLSCFVIAAYYIYKLASQLFSTRIGEKSLILFLCMPLSLVANSITTPDSPLILFWILTLYLFYQGLTSNRPGYFYGAGITAGFLLLSKYTGALLLPALFIFLLASPYRKQLLNKHIYFALGLALLMFSPVVIWNYYHQWASFEFQFVHGTADIKTFQPHLLLDFFATQALVANPVFFIALFLYCGKEIINIWRDKKLLYLFIPFAFTFLFFAYAACYAKSDVNWPMPAYLTACILLGYWWEKYGKTWLYIIGIVISISAMIVVRYPEWLPFLHSSPKSQFMGYDKLFEEGSRYIDQDTIVLSNSHQNASEAWYYLKGHPTVYILTPARFSSYNYWRKSIAGQEFKKAIFFGNKSDGVMLKSLCGEVKLLNVLHYENNYMERNYAVYECDNLKVPKDI